MAGAASEEGLAGVVPFRFACHRCGHCCTAGEGHVWLEEGELEELARAKGLEPGVFAERYVRLAVDPKDGSSRPALRTDSSGPFGSPGSGRCALLEGKQHCTVYGARPRHCRSFPFWPAVLAEREAFEAAREVCPGIAVVAPAETRRRAFAGLEELYREVDRVVEASRSVCLQRGVCCRFEEAGHELFATALEADYAAARHPDAPEPEAPGRCPYHRAGRCTAREGRPLGCRTYFCEPAADAAMQVEHAQFLERLRALERESDYPPAYARFPELLRARGVGVEAGGVETGGVETGGVETRESAPEQDPAEESA